MTSAKYAYTVVRDTREKLEQGWLFPKTEKCSGTIIQKLDSGDYSLAGLEHMVSLERKGSVNEFCTNLTQDRFCAPFDPLKPMDKQSELVRLQSIKYSYILLEFEMDELIKYPNIPSVPPRLRHSIRFKGAAALKKIIELEMMFNTRIVFCGKRGKDMASSIFKRVVEELEQARNVKNNSNT